MDEKEKEKERKREEHLKSAKFAEKFLGGLTQEHYKSKFEEIVEAQEKPVNEQELFIWEFLFKDKNKKKRK